MVIQAKIVEFYRNVAKEISRKACADWCYRCENATRYKNKTSNEENVQHLFNSLLKEIDQYLTPNRQSTETDISVEEYYRDTNVLSLDKILSDVKKALESEFQHCNHGADYNKLTSKTYRIISHKINSMYIAYIVYYKQNHRYYDKKLERAYREIISSETTQSNSILSKTTAEKIQSVSKQIINSAVHDVYDEIYNKKAINKKYKISYEEMADLINEESAIVVKYQSGSSHKHDKSSYHSMICVIAKAHLFLSPYKCVDNYFNNSDECCTVDNKTIENFIKKHLPQIFMLNYEKSKFKKYLECGFVYKKISHDFVETAIKTRELFRKNYRINSRFDIVRGSKDFYILVKMIRLYKEMLKLALSDTEFTELQNELSEDDKSELEIFSTFSEKN